jgi:elongation factor 1-alpha
MLVVGANMGVSRMTKEHIGITQALKIPMFVVVTKLDLAPPEVYN